MSLNFFLLLFCIMVSLSCNNRQREKLVIGKWKYEKTGYKLPKNTKWEFQEASKDYIIILGQDQSITVYNGPVEEYKGTYELINNGKSILATFSKPSEKDTTDILSLTSDVMQIKKRSSDVCMQLERVR